MTTDVRLGWSERGREGSAPDPRRLQSILELEALAEQTEDAEVAVVVVAVALVDGKATVEDLREHVASLRRARALWELSRVPARFPADASGGGGMVGATDTED